MFTTLQPGGWRAEGKTVTGRDSVRSGRTVSAETGQCPAMTDGTIQLEISGCPVYSDRMRIIDILMKGGGKR